MSPADNEWHDIAWSPSLGIFASVSSTGTGTRAMTATAAYSGGVIVSGTVTASANIAFVMNAISVATLQNSSREFTMSLGAVGGGGGGVLYTYTTHTFTNAGVTGRDGPSLAQCRSAYSTTWDDNSSYFNMTTNGIQLWTVPRDGTVRITAKGAQGGNSPSTGTYKGGNGAIVRSDHIVTSGMVLQILVGQMGGIDTTSQGYNGRPGVFTLNGESSSGGAGGIDGNGGGGGEYTGGGGGFFTKGGQMIQSSSTDSWPGSTDVGGLAFIDGGRGGDHSKNSIPTYSARGGFGGGGGMGHGSGGGGGASGGGVSATSGIFSGGGGGSYSATTQTNVGTGNGHGYVTIEYLL